MEPLTYSEIQDLERMISKAGLPEVMRVLASVVEAEANGWTDKDYLAEVERRARILQDAAQAIGSGE